MPKVILQPVTEKQASEPIVVRLKGGPGSGHHGHAGRDDDVSISKKSKKVKIKKQV